MAGYALVRRPLVMAIAVGIVLAVATLGAAPSVAAGKQAARGVTLGTTGETQGRGVAIGSNGDVFVAGIVNGALKGQRQVGHIDAFVARYSPTLKPRWVMQFGTTGTESVSGLVVGSDDSVYVAGTTNGAFDGEVSAGRQDVFVGAFDGDGKRRWVDQFGNPGDDAAGGLAIHEGAVHAVGTLFGGTTSPGVDGQRPRGQADGFVARYDRAGTRTLFRLLGATLSGAISDIAFDPAGNAVVGGTFNGSLNGQEAVGRPAAHVVQYDRSWQPVRTSSYQADQAIDVRALALGGDGSVYLGGTLQQVGGSDAIVVAFDGTGVRRWVQTFGTPGSSNQFQPESVEALVVLRSGAVVAGGVAGGDICAGTATSSGRAFVRTFTAGGAPGACGASRVDATVDALFDRAAASQGDSLIAAGACVPAPRKKASARSSASSAKKVYEAYLWYAFIAGLDVDVAEKLCR